METDGAVAALKGLFPDMPEAKLLDALLQCGGDAQQAADRVLRDSEPAPAPAPRRRRRQGWHAVSRRADRQSGPARSLHAHGDPAARVRSAPLRPRPVPAPAAPRHSYANVALGISPHAPDPSDAALARLAQIFPTAATAQLERALHLGNHELSEAVSHMLANAPPEGRCPAGAAAPTAPATAGAADGAGADGGLSSLPHHLRAVARHWTPVARAAAVITPLEGVAAAPVDYKEARRLARRAQEKRQTHCKRAAKAFGRSDRAVGQGLIQAAEEERHEAARLNADAAAAIFRARNADNPRGAWRLDLHGLHVTEALEALAGRLYALETAPDPPPVPSAPGRPPPMELDVVTGAGRHSEHNLPSLGPAVKSFLNEHSVAFTATRSGALAVRVRRGVRGLGLEDAAAGVSTASRARGRP